jgi:hypothetical protein
MARPSIRLSDYFNQLLRNRLETNCSDEADIRNNPTFILEVFSSNLGQDADCPDLESPWLSRDPSGKNRYVQMLSELSLLESNVSVRYPVVQKKSKKL